MCRDLPACFWSCHYFWPGFFDARLWQIVQNNDQRVWHCGYCWETWRWRLKNKLKIQYISQMLSLQNTLFKVFCGKDWLIRNLHLKGIKKNRLAFTWCYSFFIQQRSIYRSRQYHESKVLHNTEVKIGNWYMFWLSKETSCCNFNYATFVTMDSLSI